MTTSVPKIMISPTRKRPRQEETSVKKFIPSPSPKRRITRLGNHPQILTPKFALSTGVSGDPASGPGFSSPQTPNKHLLVNHNGYARTSTSCGPLHQSPWHEFKYAKHNPTEPSSILYFEKQRQIACTETDDRARIAERESIETGVATTVVTIPLHPTKTLTHMQKAATPAPARLLYDPYIFMSERKPALKLPPRQGFTFGGNHLDAELYHSVIFDRVISHHSIPTGAISTATLAQTSSTRKDSRMANFAATAVAGAARFYVEADSIVSSLSRSYSLAKAALVGNRDSKIAERKATQKVVIRRRIEEEERLRREELFGEFEKFEAQNEQRNRENINAIEEIIDLAGERAAACTEGPGSRNWQIPIKHDVELLTERNLKFSGANGDPSFATEDTIPDTAIAESLQVSETGAIVSSSPVARTHIPFNPPSPISAPVVYPNFPIAVVDNLKESSSVPLSSDVDSGGMESPELELPQQVINLDSDDEIISSG